MKKKKVLFLTTQLPYPPNSGGVIKSFKLVEFLSKRYHLHLFCLLKASDKVYEQEFLKQSSIAGYYSEPIEKGRTAANYLKSILASKTLNEFRNYSLTFKTHVLADLEGFDAIFIDHLEMFQYVPESFKGKIVFHEHNAEWLLWERYGKLEARLISSAVLKFESIRVKRRELQSINAADLTFASPNDRQQFITSGAQPNKIKETYHLGNDSLLAEPRLDFKSLADDIIFMGTLSWEANVDGIVHFIEHTFPLVLQSMPNTKLHIVGKSPDNRIVELAASNPSSIVIHGYIKEITEVFELGKVFILPLRFGSGMKVKFLDALYRGLPIVSTTIGAEGIQVTNGVEAFISDSPAEFATHIHELLTNQQKWEATSTCQRALAKSKYTWSKHLEEIAQELSLIV